jgi:hypothetical protein
MEYEKLPRIEPEEVNINSYYIYNLIKNLELENVEIHNLMIAVDGKIIFELSNYPYAPEIPHLIHSMTKTFTNTAVAKAFTDGLIKLDDKVIDYFDSDVYAENTTIENLSKMTIENLISMRSGHSRSISGSEWRPLKTSWVEAFFKEPVVYEPGSKFCYSSANSYILSAIIQKITGMTVHEYLKSNILKKIGIRDFTWDLSPEGINSGGNGIKLCIEDIAKLGLFYQQKGQWNEEQLISREWIDKAFGFDGSQNYEDMERPYNFHWYKFGEIYTGAGIFGQHCMVIPKLNMVIGITAAMDEWLDLPPLVNKYFIDILIDKKDSCNHRLNFIDDYPKRANLLPRNNSAKSHPEFTAFEEIYLAEDNSDEIKMLSFRQADYYIIFCMEDDRGLHSVQCKLDSWMPTVSSITGNYLHHQYQEESSLLYTSAWWESPRKLRMEWRFVEMAFCDYITFDFSEDMSTVTMNRSVNVNTQDKKRQALTARKI